MKQELRFVLTETKGKPSSVKHSHLVVSEDILTLYALPLKARVLSNSFVSTHTFTTLTLKRSSLKTLQWLQKESKT